MTDSRVSDLSFGHLGDATYDMDGGEWGFSVNTSQSQIFEQITPFSKCLPAAFQSIPNTVTPPHTFTQAQMKWMIKTRPEIFPANIITTALTKTSAAQKNDPPPSGELLAVGSAVDTSHRPKRRTHRIVAIPSGEAGHVLRLIRLQAEPKGWRKKGAVKLSLFDAASRDVGHWIGVAGMIRQITSAGKGRRSRNFLATRQDSIVTIFRPMYHEQPVRAVAPSGYDKQHPPSRLSANPVAVLTAEVCGSRRHADISFNPFYTRQFGVVDDSGHWSIWDIEGSRRTDTVSTLVPGKKGGIYDDFGLDPGDNSPKSTDGWHRILWAANVTTIVVCNRRYIAVFDVEGTPTRLPSCASLSTTANNGILDIKRSPMDSKSIFVLTTFRVFWIEVIPAGSEKDGHDAGFRVIQSYRHFRDVGDETMNLTVLKEDDVRVLISSSKNPLVSFYTFSMTSGHTDAPTSSKGSFTFSTGLDNQAPSDGMLQTTYFVPARLSSNPSRAPGPEQQLVERNVKFYQVLALTPTLELKSTLCAMYTMPSRAGLPRLHITAPTSKVPIRRHLSESRVDSFIVADDVASEEDDYTSAYRLQRSRQHRKLKKKQGKKKNKKPGLNWRRTFQRVYTDTFRRGPPNSNLANSYETMSELVGNLSHHIEQMTEIDSTPMTSLLELSQFSELSGDLQQSAPIFGNFLEMLQQNQNAHDTFDLILSDLTSCPGIGLTVLEGSKFSDLLRIYDQVGEYWMASLPLRVSNLTRLSKFKIARKIAIELCLSSIAVSTRKKSQQARDDILISGGIDLPLYEQPNHSPSLRSLRAMRFLPEAGFSLPTPSQTPSVYSHASNDTSEPGENASITRLRQYAVSIKTLPDLGESAVLSQWPSIPGFNPAQYKWTSLIAEDVAEVNRRQREEARRRKKAEKFLHRERMRGLQRSSQPTLLRSGSQPEFGLPAKSSQSVGDVPMTQPDRGVFGARSTKRGKKKPRKRAAGF